MPTPSEARGMSLADLDSAIASPDVTERDVANVKSELKDRQENQRESSEVLKIFEASTGMQRAELSTRLLKEDMKEAGIENLGHANQFPDKPRGPDDDPNTPPEKVDFLDLSKENKENNEPNKPQVWFRQVTQMKGFWTKKEQIIDEALVVSRDNKSKSGRNNEANVTLALLKHKDGVPDFKTGWRYTVSQERYQKIITSDVETLGRQDQLLRRMIDGKTSIKELERIYPHMMGKSHRKNWQERDKALKENPEHWVLKDQIKEETEALFHDYDAQIETTIQKGNEIRRNQEEAQIERARRIETEIWGNGWIRGILRTIVETQDNDDPEVRAIAERHKRDLANIPLPIEITDEELQNLLQRVAGGN